MSNLSKFIVYVLHTYLYIHTYRWISLKLLPCHFEIIYVKLVKRYCDDMITIQSHV